MKTYSYAYIGFMLGVLSAAGAMYWWWVNELGKDQE